MLRFQLDTTGNLLKDLIAFWPLDEPGGERRDMLGYNPLTDNNTVTSAKGIGGQGTAANFVAANSEYLSISDNPQISTGDVDFTLSVWAYFDSLTTDNRVFAAKWSSAGTKEFLFLYDLGPDKFMFNVSNDGTAQTGVSSDETPTTGRWYFIAAWHDSVNNTINIQVDNGPPKSVSHSTGVLNSTSGIRIGHNQHAGLGAQHMDGRLQYFGFWKRVLSQQERTDLYNFGRGNRLIVY